MPLFFFFFGCIIGEMLIGYEEGGTLVWLLQWWEVSERVNGSKKYSRAMGRVLCLQWGHGWTEGREEKSFLNLLESIDRINSFCTLSSQSNSQRWSDSRHKELDSTSNGETKTFGSHLVYHSFHNQMLKAQYRWAQQQYHNWQGSSDLRCHFHTPLKTYPALQN